ncbi:MAG: hypothetical protein ACP5PC_07760 [bacterium]
MNILKEVSEEELKRALLNEYRRKLLIYEFINEKMTRKYGMSFSEFEKMNLVEKEDFSWEIESDAMEWEHAVEGIRYLREKILKIESEK